MQVRKFDAIDAMLLDHRFFCASDITTPQIARAYLARRCHDAVSCYRAGHHRTGEGFSSVIQLARYLATFW